MHRCGLVFGSTVLGFKSGLRRTRIFRKIEPPMNNTRTCHSRLAHLLCGFLSLAITLTTQSAEQSNLQPLFNGKDLSGWRVPDPNPFWRVENGVLMGENDEKRKGHVLFTEKDFKD